MIKKFLIKVPGLKEFYNFIKESIIYSLQIKKWKILKKKKLIKLDLGSDKKGGNDFVTIDYLGGDIAHNLIKPLPLDTNTVNEIYTSHTLEHFNFNNIILILKECKRILKTGGKLKVCVPNSRLYIESYLNKKNFEERKSWYEPGLTNTGSHIDQVNYIAYLNGHHQYLFDEENLVNIIKKSGFEQVMLREFEKDLDLKERHFESIYAIAIK